MPVIPSGLEQALFWQHPPRVAIKEKIANAGESKCHEWIQPFPGEKIED